MRILKVHKFGKNSTAEVIGHSGITDKLVWSSPAFTERGITYRTCLNGGSLNIAADVAGNLFNTKKFSYTAWIAPKTTGCFCGISGMAYPNNRGFSCFVYPSIADFHCSFQNDQDETVIGGVVNNAFTGTMGWYHIAYTIDEGVHKFYVNGILKETWTEINWNKNWTSYTSNVPICNGAIAIFDSVSIYNHPLSQEEVVDDYNSLFMLVNYNLASVKNQQTPETGTVVPNALTFYGNNTTSPNSGGFVAMNGTSSYYSITATHKCDKYLTVNCWAYKSNWAEFATRDERIFSCTQASGWNIEPESTSASARFRIPLYVGGGYIHAYSSMGCNALASGWHMFTMVWNGDQSRLYFYIDGVLQSSATGSEQYIRYTNNQGTLIYVGAEAEVSTVASNGYFQGNMGEFRMYGNAFTQAKVTDLYTRGIKILKNNVVTARDIGQVQTHKDVKITRNGKSLLTNYANCAEVPIRYIRDTIDFGSTANAALHWNGMRIYAKDGTNHSANAISRLNGKMKEDGTMDYSLSSGTISKYLGSSAVTYDYSEATYSITIQVWPTNFGAYVFSKTYYYPYSDLQETLSGTDNNTARSTISLRVTFSTANKTITIDNMNAAAQPRSKILNFAYRNYTGPGTESTQALLKDTIVSTNWQKDGMQAGANPLPSIQYQYTGTVQAITLTAGDYRIECWGADGGTNSTNTGTTAGKGGYSKGTLKLTASTNFYAYVGGVGGNTTQPLGGYNSGNTTTKTNLANSTGGGGATDLRVLSDSLYNRIVVAGGGGGQGNTTGSGGDGGGTNGGDGKGTVANIGKGGTQTAAGVYPAGNDSKSATFGAGGDGPSGTTGGQGGGGWYGGSFGTRTNGGGAGGSGYVLTTSSYKPSGYFSQHANYYLSDAKTISANETGFVANPATNGNGYIRITKIGSMENSPCQLIDLGAIRLVNRIVVHHYGEDRRRYGYHKLEVSEDGKEWVTIHDSDISGTPATLFLGYTDKANHTEVPIASGGRTFYVDQWKVWITKANGQVIARNFIR